MESSAPIRVKIFMSYAAEDSRDAKTLAAALRRAGMDAYGFTENECPAGVDFRARLQEILAEAHFFVLLWSKHAHESKWIANEIAFVEQRDKLILPILMDDVQPLPQSLSSTQAIRAFGDQLGWELQVVNHIRAHIIARIEIIQQYLTRRLQEQHEDEEKELTTNASYRHFVPTTLGPNAPSNLVDPRSENEKPVEPIIGLGGVVSGLKNVSNSPKMKAAATVATLVAVAAGIFAGRNKDV